MAKSKPYSLDIAEYSAYLNRVSSVLNINLKQAITDVLEGPYGLMSTIKDYTPVSDNLGKDGGPVKKSRSGLPGVHARDIWKASIITEGNKTRVNISNAAPYAYYLEYGSTKKGPWPNPSSYDNPRTVRMKDPLHSKLHGTRRQMKVWAGARDPGPDMAVGGPVAAAMAEGSYTGRRNWAGTAKGYASIPLIWEAIQEARAALSRDRARKK